MTRLTLILLALTTAASAQSLTQPTSRPAAWTLLFPGTHRYFVSSSTGSDTNPGSPFAPFKTISRAVGAVHDGDDLLLKRGDIFHESFGNHRWSHVTIGAYGTGPRPLVLSDTKTQSCLVNLNGQNLRVVGLHLSAWHRDPSQPDFKLVEGQFGIYCMNCSNVLIEDCLIEYFDNNISIEGNGTGFRLRRSVVRYAWSAGKSFSQGIFLDGQKNALIEDSVFDTCGWNPILQAENDSRAASPQSTQPATLPSNRQSAIDNRKSPAWIQTLQPQPNQPFPGVANIFNHAIYDNSANGAGPSLIRDCIFVNAASTAIQQRPGGTIDNCLFIHNGKATDAFTSGAYGEITNCVVLGSQQCPAWAGGGGLSLLSYSGKLQNNLILHGSPAQSSAALVVDLPKGQENAPPDAVALVDHNIVYDWPGDDLFVFHSRPLVQITNNLFCKTPKRQVEVIDLSNANYQFNSNTYEQSPQQLSFKQKLLTLPAFEQAANETNGKQLSSVQFVDPTRTIESYAKLLGLSTSLSDLMNLIDQQARDQWDIRLTAPVINDYFREGFALKQ